MVINIHILELFVRVLRSNLVKRNTLIFKMRIVLPMRYLQAETIVLTILSRRTMTVKAGCWNHQWWCCKQNGKMGLLPSVTWCTWSLGWCRISSTFGSECVGWESTRQLSYLPLFSSKIDENVNWSTANASTSSSSTYSAFHSRSPTRAVTGPASSTYSAFHSRSPTRAVTEVCRCF
jgi:hypothetical protein